LLEAARQGDGETVNRQIGFAAWRAGHKSGDIQAVADSKIAQIDL
jgi:hypothetical protein